MKKIFAVLAVFLSLPAHALDGVFGEFGPGDRDASIIRAGVVANHDLRWLPARVRLYWELSIAQWDTQPGSVNELALTPVFRYARAGRGPYVEGAIGLHFLSTTSVHRDAPFSTHFQFGDHVGVGYRFAKYDLGMRLQHLSNAGLRNPNPGINFLLIRIARELE